MFRPEKVGDKIVSLSWHEMAATIRKNELYIDHLEKEYGTKYLTRSESEQENREMNATTINNSTNQR